MLDFGAGIENGVLPPHNDVLGSSKTFQTCVDDYVKLGAGDAG